MGCKRSDGTSPAKDTRHFDLIVWLDPQGEVGPKGFALFTAPAEPVLEFFDHPSGLRLAVIRIPREGDPAEVIERAMGEVHYRADTHAAFFVTTRCLSDLQPALKKNLLGDWFVAIVVGARCDGGYEPRMAAAAQIAIGSASRVRITFDDRSTHAILKVEPLP
jgi:hypothetical protein